MPDAEILTLSNLAHLVRPDVGLADFATFEQECRRLGLRWPTPATEQFLFDHGGKGAFLRQYDHLNLLRVEWHLNALTARELIGCTYDDDLGGRVTEVAANPRYWLARYRSLDSEVWTTTWKVPPIGVKGSLRNPPQQGLHLVEGHTRLGVLTGLVQAGEVDPDSLHEIFVGSPSPA